MKITHYGHHGHVGNKLWQVANKNSNVLLLNFLFCTKNMRCNSFTFGQCQVSSLLWPPVFMLSSNFIFCLQLWEWPQPFNFSKRNRITGKHFLWKTQEAYLLTESWYPNLDWTSFVPHLHFLHQAVSLLIDWCCRPTAFSATWLRDETDSVPSLKIHTRINKKKKIGKIRWTLIKIIYRSTRKIPIHLHPKHRWPPSPERCLSGLSSRNLFLTGNQSACALGLKASHPSNCPYLDIETDTRLNFGSSLQKCVKK